MPKLKITKKNMSEIVHPVSGQVDYFDTDITGFGVRVTKDTKTFMVYHRIRGQKNKTYIIIGKYGLFTTEQARITAKDYLRRMSQGENPHPKYNQGGEKITIADLYRQYISAKKSPLAGSTQYAYNSWMNNHFSDWLQRSADSITGSDVLDRLTRIEKENGPVQAANSIKLLKGLYRMGMALHRGVITFNPVDAVRAVRGRAWTPYKRRTRYIKIEDMPRWFKAVSEYHLPKGRDFMLFLLYTGLRRNEAARLKWSDINFKGKSFSFIPEKKRGEKPEDDRVTMPLSIQAYKLMFKRRAVGIENEYVFPGKHPSPYISNPDNWKRDIIKASGVTFCFHDLRRTFITVAEGLDIGHYSLKALLNHSMGNDVTGGYIQLSTERLRESVQRISDRITEMATAKIEEPEEVEERSVR